MTDFSQKKQDSPETPQLAGSVFINNTSYSGADIKVLVTVYDTGKTNKGPEYQKEAENVQKQIDNNEREISKLNIKIQNSKPATFERDRYLAERNTRILLNQNNIRTLESLQESIRKAALSSNKVSTKVLAEAQTISVSVFREKEAVRSLGSVYPKGFTRGQRTVAGSMIFTVFDENVFYRFLEAHASDFDANNINAAILDQIPPVDILIAFANEYGSLSRMMIRGVEFLNEGQVMSIEDILTENTVQFVARDIEPMRAVSSPFNLTDITSADFQRAQPTRASDLILEEDFQFYKDQADPYKRFKRRRNPFL